MADLSPDQCRTALNAKETFGLKASGRSAYSSRLALISSWRRALKGSCDAGGCAGCEHVGFGKLLPAGGHAGGLVALEGELGLWQKCHSPGTSLSCSWHQADGRDEHLPAWDALGLF